MRDLILQMQQRADAAEAPPRWAGTWHRRRAIRRGFPQPPWETDAERDAVDAFVAARPPGMTIEHIAPLGHPEIVGLHVLANLAYLPRRENQRKGNALPEGMSPAEAVERGMAIWRRDVDGHGTVCWEMYGRPDRRVAE